MSSWHTIEVPGSDVAQAATVAALDALFGGAKPDGAIGSIKVGVWPDIAIADLRWHADIGHWVGNGMQLVNSADQGYLGLPNTAVVGNANDNSHLMLLYVGATAYNVASAGVAAMSGYFCRSVEHIYDFLAAGLKLQGSLAALIAGNGVQTMSIVPLFFARADGDVPGAFGGDGTNLLPPADAVGGVYPDTNNVLKLVSPAAALPNGAQYKATGWQDLSGFINLANIAVGKKYLVPRMFGKMSAAVQNPNGGGAAIDIDLQARWVS